MVRATQERRGCVRLALLFQLQVTSVDGEIENLDSLRDEVLLQPPAAASKQSVFLKLIIGRENARTGNPYFAHIPRTGSRV